MVETPGDKPRRKGKKQPKTASNATATLLRFPVLGTRAVIGESIPFKALQSKNMSGWMEELWSVVGFRHLFEGTCDLRASELGCGGQNDGIVFPERRWHMNIYALERSNYEDSGFFIEDIFNWIGWRGMILAVGAAAVAVLVVALRPFFDRRSPGRLAKLKSMTFVEHDRARVQQEMLKMGR